MSTIADVALSMQRGTSLIFSIDVSDPNTGQEYDLSQPNVEAVLSVARRRGATPLIQHTYLSSAPHANAGLQLGATNHALTAEILPTDTLARTDGSGAFASDERLVWDLIVSQPSGDSDVVARGTLLVLVGAGS